MFNTKTVDGVLSEINKLVNDLDEVASLQKAKADRQQDIIAAAQVKRDEAAAEKIRAARVRDKIKELVA